MQRSTRQEECPALVLLAHIRQLLQVPHLADGRAPLHQQPLMQTPASLDPWRPRLESNSVASHGGEVVVVEPSDGLLGAFHADGLAVVAGACLALGLVGVAEMVRRMLIPAEEGYGLTCATSRNHS